MGEEPTTSQHYAKDGEAAVERPPPPSGHNNMHLGGVFKAGLGHLAKSSLKKRKRKRKPIHCEGCQEQDTTLNLKKKTKTKKTSTTVESFGILKSVMVSFTSQFDTI